MKPPVIENDPRIKAKVTRHNNKMNARFPLFADQFKTTYKEEEKKKIIAINSWYEQKDRMIKRHAEQWMYIELMKRQLIEYGHGNDVDFAYSMWLKYYRFGTGLHNGNEFLADTLTGMIAKLWCCIPLEVYFYFKDKAK